MRHRIYIVDVLFGNFAYPHNLYTVVELHSNYLWIQFEIQPMFQVENKNKLLHWIQERPK